jgi:type IV secretory pathway VirB4 component
MSIGVSAVAKPPTPNNPTNSTQNSLLIAEIKDGIVVMRDGSLRAVVLSSAINFDLMSQAEQDGVEMAYQGFLNSLHFPIQILIKSQKIDLDGYIAKLEKLEQDQDNPLLGELMEDYIGNIKALVDQVNIMDKQFFVVVPYFPIVNLAKGNVATNIGKVFQPIGTITLDAGQFEAAKTELRQRVQLVASALTQMGLRAIPLNTQELIDLYYSAYNPDVAQNQKLIDAAQLQTASVTKGPGRTERPIAGGGV